MRDHHDPQDAFVDRLEREITAEVTRRRRLGQAPRPTSWTRWIPQSPVKAAVAAALLVIVSMAIGGGVVAASYQAQNNQHRDLLIANYEQRVALATQRVTTVNGELQAAQQRVAVGVQDQDALLGVRFTAKQAEVELKTAESQLAEVRLSGREPQTEVSAPLVAGRDFVTERWQIEMAVPVALLELETARLQSAQRRVAAGIADPIDVEMARVSSIVVQSAVDAAHKRLAIRQSFLKKETDAALAGLYVLELEAAHRVNTLGPQVDLAKRNLEQVSAKFKTGLVSNVAVAEAQLRVQERTLEVTKAQLDLVTVRQQIDLRRGK